MKIMLILVSPLAVLISGTTARGEDMTTDSVEGNKSVVLRYLKEVLEAGNINLMDELFAPDVVIHRPEGTLSNLSQIKAIYKMVLSQGGIETTVHDIFGTEDRVAVRISHKSIFPEGEMTRSRLGFHKVPGKAVTWDAIAIFRLKDGKIVEEWVQLDDLGRLMQFGTVSLLSFQQQK